jgi:hypothetical protein
VTGPEEGGGDADAGGADCDGRTTGVDAGAERTARDVRDADADFPARDSAARDRDRRSSIFLAALLAVAPSSS